MAGSPEELERELRRTEERLRESQRLAQLGSWELSLTTNELHWSEEIFRIFEIDPARFGASYEAFLACVHPADREAVDAAYQRSVREREAYEITHRLLFADGRVKHVIERGRTYYGDDGAPLRSIGTVQDVTARVAMEEALASQLRDREHLLRELNHRVKNNLQVVSSLLSLHVQRVDDGAALLRALRVRVFAMALAHDELHVGPGNASLDAAAYARALTLGLRSILEVPSDRVTLVVEGPTFEVDADRASPFGLVLCELVSNALLHAFPGERRGRVTVAFGRLDGDPVVEINDDGVGFAAGDEPNRHGGLGLRVAPRFAAQLDATFERLGVAVGTAYRLRLRRGGAAEA